MNKLSAGDILAYSSGSTRGGPSGFRKVQAERNLLQIAGARWPDLIELLIDRTPIIINAYPANLGRFEFGIVVDSYLSAKTVSRALELAVREKHPVILMGQPLFIAELVFAYAEAGRPFPETLILAIAGYVMPQSLERALLALCRRTGCSPQTVYFYGVAEVDSSCLGARDRNTKGELLYYPMGDEVGVNLDGDQLLLSLHSGSGELLVDRFATGDRARKEGDAYVLWNPERASPHVLNELDRWGPEEWKRRTGYMASSPTGEGAKAVQLREGMEPFLEGELTYYDYGKRFGFNWLAKPEWS